MNNTHTKLMVLIIFLVLQMLFLNEVAADDLDKPSGDKATNNQGNTPSDFSGDGTGGSTSVPPPNPIIIDGVQIKDYRGLSASGNSIKFSSATYAKSSSFSFNDITNANLNADNGKLSYAQVTSNKDNNVLSINNPYSPS